MLLSTVSKIFTRIILNRIKSPVDAKLRREQAGFRENRSCIDQINTLRIIIEQTMEYQSTLYLSFIDFEKAFDSIKREKMWQAMKTFGIPTKIINLLQEMYREFSCRVEINGSLTETISMRSGVRQRCLLSPILFLMVLDIIMRKTIAKEKRGIY
jgi:hypothetical protein